MDLDDEELKATRRMNGSDKNVACIEKEIKILEEIKDMFIHLKNYGWINDIKKDIDTDKAIQAIEHLIKAYKELEEENEICKEELEKIDKVLNLEAGRAAPYRNDIIEGLKRGIIQLRKIIDNSIPVSLVEEKIEEYKQRIEKYNEYKKQEKETDVEFYENITNTAIVQVLQELLKGER